jgi:diketogulonate reductase-like aldo/keto reductase
MNDLLLDKIWGLLWEEKFRGDIDDVPYAKLNQLKDTAEKLKPPEIKSKVSTPISWPSLVGWGSYGWKYNPEIVETALRLAVPLIDTAEGYGFGRVEQELGRVLKKVRDRNTQIASKFSRNHSSYKAVVSAAQRSRDKLNIPTIDLYQIHWPVVSKFDEIFRALRWLSDKGVVKKVGVCNFSTYQLYSAWSVARRYDLEIASLQIRLDSLNSTHFNLLVPAATRLGLKIIAHSPLGQGAVKDVSRQINGLTARGIIVIAGTNSVAHLTENVTYQQKTPR